MSDESQAVDQAMLAHLRAENERLEAEVSHLQEALKRPVYITATPPMAPTPPPDPNLTQMLYALQGINASVSTIAQHLMKPKETP